MYALHPGSLPPRSPKATDRIDITAADLMALYGVAPEDCITWDPADQYDWFDFIHLYPSYYDRYTLRPDGNPENDVPVGFESRTRTGPPDPKPTRRNAAKSSRAHDRARTA